MIAEPYKIKEVKKLLTLKPYERWNLLKKAYFNTFHISSDHVTFELVARGMSSWSHFQKAAYMVGDEAYAGSRNYIHLQEVASKVLGLTNLVPAHNRIGAEKLITTTLIEKGQQVLHNRGRAEGLVPACGGQSVDLTCQGSCQYLAPEAFGGDIDLDRMEEVLRETGRQGVAYIHMETCPSDWTCQPVSLANLEGVRELSTRYQVPFVLDISSVLENAFWIREVELRDPELDLMDVIRRIIGKADVVLCDASQDFRSDVGAFVASPHPELFEKLRNQVVVYEGLHTYGGMTGRAMEVLAVGIEEMERTELVVWHARQIRHVTELLQGHGVPVRPGSKSIILDVEAFLQGLPPEAYPKFVLASALYIYGGIRGPIDGSFEHHASGPGAQALCLEIPRCAYTQDQLREIASVIGELYENRSQISGLELLNAPEFVDEARFKPQNQRLFVTFPHQERRLVEPCEPYKIAIFEPVSLPEKAQRARAMAEAGYNTFLLRSEDVYIDLLTDSGTSAMSCYQWEGMTNSSDTPYSSRHYLNLVKEFSDILGYNYIIPTHQGRAAEHIMSQVMIQPGQIVPGNMYFTTTKLHQEMAGGIFADVIVDEAHDPQSQFPWKGNIDLEKLDRLIALHGPQKIAYISFEMSVNLAGGQPFSMDNVRELSRLCQKHGIPIMFDATRCVENAYMIKRNDSRYASSSVREILPEMLSYGDGCTISCKKDFLVNMGGILACNSTDLNRRFLRMLRIWEGEITNGGLDPKDMETLHRKLLDALDDHYIMTRIEQTQRFGQLLMEAGIPIVEPAGSHAIFIDARRFLPQIDQDEYPAQALAAAIYIETGIRTMERGNVSKGRDPETGENYRPALELVRCTIPRRVYTNAHIDYVVEGIKRVWEKREKLSGLRFVYEPKVLRFFQGRFEPISDWDL